MTKTINFEITYTPWTIDTYNTFDFESHDDQEIENYNAENNTNLYYDDFNWSYNHKGLVKQLADNWLNLTRETILDNVIKAIEPNGEPYSPREYNFTTDNQSINFTVNYDALLAYIEDNKEHYNVNKIQSCSGFWWLGEEDQTMLHYYLAYKSAADYPEFDYISDQSDLLNGNGQIYEFVTYEPIKK